MLKTNSQDGFSFKEPPSGFPISNLVLFMGNIRTKDIKKASRELIRMYPDRFDKEFENNKQIMKELNLIDSKIVRNKVAGYITTLKTQKKRRYIPRESDRDERIRDRY